MRSRNVLKDSFEECLNVCSSLLDVRVEGILIFWVSPLKLLIDRRDIEFMWFFQSSFSEFDLWNKGYAFADDKRSTPFNPHFLGMTFEINLDLGERFPKLAFQSSFSGYDLWNAGKKFIHFKNGQIFQSSSSEYDHWNLHDYQQCKCYQLLSILIFWVLSLKL